MEPSKLVALVRSLSNASQNLTHAELVNCHRLSHVVQAASQHEWRRIITTSPHDAVLTVYMSDGWGGDVRSVCTARSGGAQLVLRRGKLRQEFLLQRGFMKKQSVDGAMATCMRVAEPLGLGLGRGAWSVFSGGLRFRGDPQGLGRNRDHDIVLCFRWLSLRTVEQTPDSKASAILFEGSWLRSWTSA